MLDPTTGFAAAWHRRLLDRRKEKERERLAKDKDRKIRETADAQKKKAARKNPGTEIE